MRALLIGSVFPRSDSDDQVPWMRQMCLRLKQQGVDVEFLAPSYQGLRSHTVEGITVHRFRYAPKSIESLTGEGGAPSKMRKNPLLKLLAIPYLWCGFWKLFSLLCKNRYDVVEVHWPFPLAYMALPALWAGVPVTYHYHSAELKQAAMGGLARLLFKMSLPWAKAHVVNSSYTASLLKEFAPKLAPEIIPYGSPLKLSGDAQKSSYKKLLFVGRHIERKGIAYLVEAMKTLPENYTLTIVGSGPLTDILKKLASNDSRIIFTGRLSDDELAQAYQSHDVFVLPAIVDANNDTEGLGVVLIEAIAAGLVLVGSRVGGIVDVIKDGQTGLLVEPKDAAGLAGAIKRVGEDTALAQSLAAGASAHAQEYFSWERVVAQQQAFFERVVRKK